MVELRLNTEDWQSFAKDHYMSVRVGENQKLGRVSASRSYKFPSSAIANRKYGKVEIYRRVGSAMVCIDPKMASGVNDVDVEFDGCIGTNTALKFEAELVGPGNEKPASPTKAPSTAETITEKATEYMEKHDLEARLAEAVHAVLRARPADPAAFLAEQLLKNGKAEAKLPSPTKSAVEEAKQGPLVAETSKITPPSEAQEHPAQAVAELSQPLLQVAPTCGECYAKHFDEYNPLGNFGPNSKFPAAVVLPPPVQARVPDATPSFLPSMGSFQGPVLRFGGIARRTPKSQIAPARVELAMPAPAEIPAAMLPSVGTWLVNRRMGVPKQVVPVAGAKPVAPVGGSVAEIPAAMLPSVGTWLVNRRMGVPKQIGPVAGAKPAAPVSGSVAEIPAAMLPSVGTWLVNRRMGVPKQVGEVAGVAPIAPNGGSVSVPVASLKDVLPAEEKSVEAQCTSHMALNATVMGSYFWSSGLQPSLTFW
jgi:hypothetical protein